MAEALREPPSTVQSWKAAGRIPSTKQPGILSRAVEIGVDVTAEDVVFPLKQRSLSNSAEPSISPSDPAFVEPGDPITHFDRVTALKRGDA